MYSGDQWQASVNIVMKHGFCKLQGISCLGEIVPLFCCVSYVMETNMVFCLVDTQTVVAFKRLLRILRQR
jgi:hypothetical protein